MVIPSVRWMGMTIEELIRKATLLTRDHGFSKITKVVAIELETF
jgi:hypothetical protein